MKFQHHNRHSLDNLHTQDCIFEGFHYSYQRRKISFWCENAQCGKRFRFQFNNVIFSTLQSCSFWHGGDRIYDISIVEDSRELLELVAIQKEKGYSNNYLDQGIVYIAIEIQIVSGDTLLIVCDSLDVEEETLPAAVSWEDIIRRDSGFAADNTLRDVYKNLF